MLETEGGYLAAIFPPVGKLRLPFSRDQFMLLMAALNEVLLAVEIYLAHSISGTIVPNERIPIIFGPIAGALLLLAGLLARRSRPLATIIANAVFVVSIAVGLLGAYFHLVRAALPAAPAGQQISVNLLVWAPPILGPLTFSLVGLLGISASWLEEPLNSGRLWLFGERYAQLPYSKTRAYFFIVGMGSLATVISSVLDHARTGFENPWLWLPTGVGVFATVVSVLLGALDKPNRGDLLTYTGAMLLMVLVGVVGAALHVSDDLTAAGTVVVERFIRGAPILAPLLFSNIGAIGLLVLLDPAESAEESSSP